MLFKSILSVAALLFVGAAAQKQAPRPPVFTATRVFKTVTDVAPFIVDATTTITWTYVLFCASFVTLGSLPAAPSAAGRGLTRHAQAAITYTNRPIRLSEGFRLLGKITDGLKDSEHRNRRGRQPLINTSAALPRMPFPGSRAGDAAKRRPKAITAHVQGTEPTPNSFSVFARSTQISGIDVSGFGSVWPAMRSASEALSNRTRANISAAPDGFVEHHWSVLVRNVGFIKVRQHGFHTKLFQIYNVPEWHNFEVVSNQNIKIIFPSHARALIRRVIVYGSRGAGFIGPYFKFNLL
ncbi:hypothetical protein FB45DRAFT_864273 [Roridomyces roridus]|uniref:Uncharacterized protein n=1 Tax=Roridomyces roridus TaxID=1738132 RepID=A0AAD7C137_9AGAR|nr:hypothetical protein FB45DRAFT_864273 [Roridomyces roridus]